MKLDDLMRQLWEWQESIDSPIAAKILLVQTIAKLGHLEKVSEAAKAVTKEWCSTVAEIGPLNERRLLQALKELEEPAQGEGGS